MEDKKKNAWNSNASVTAPVGLTFSKGIPIGQKQNISFSFMAVVLDVGAIVDYQLSSDSEDKIESKITFGNIFSPGGYLVIGAPWNLPISGGIGGQWGPGLSEIEPYVDSSPNWRWGWFIAVDIPMFNIWNVNK